MLHYSDLNKSGCHQDIALKTSIIPSTIQPYSLLWWNMAKIIMAYLSLNINIAVNGNNKMKYFSTTKEQMFVGELKEERIKDYVTLAADPRENLPDRFTICSSVFVKFAFSNTCILEMLNLNSQHWFLLQLSTKERNHKSISNEDMKIWYKNPQSGNNEFEKFTDTGVPIVPHTWYHVCMGLDTVSGLLRVVLNGKVVVNDEREYFRNTSHWKSNSVEGKIIQFKGYVGVWIQHLGKFSNLNIFNSLISVEQMVSRTSGGEDCYSSGDYLR